MVYVRAITRNSFSLVPSLTLVRWSSQDHNYATSGGALMVDGRYDLETAMAPAERGGLDWQLNNVLFLANNALWCGGAIRWVSIWPLRFDLVNVQFLDGDALIGHAIIGSLYCNAISDAFYNPDPAVADSSRWTSTNVLISGTNRPRDFGLIIYGPTAYGCHSAASGTTFDYVFDRVAYIDCKYLWRCQNLFRKNLFRNS